MKTGKIRIETVEQYEEVNARARKLRFRLMHAELCGLTPEPGVRKAYKELDAAVVEYLRRSLPT